MKTNRKKTNEEQIQEVLLSLMILLAIAVIVFQTLKIGKRIEQTQPDIEDLHQQQEMIDYHRTQGRSIATYNSIN